jgi:HSP20 family protein
MKHLTNAIACKNPLDIYELRTPVTSLFDQLITDMFNDDPFKSLKGHVDKKAYPRVDVRRDGKDLVFEASVPFVKEEDLSVSLKDGVLRISGDIEQHNKINRNNFVRQELVRSSFARSFPLDEELYRIWKESAAEVKHQAELKDGILSIKLLDFYPDKPPDEEILF